MKENMEEIKEKANLCLGCKTRPCSNACPMQTSIPEFIAKIKEEKIEEAYDILIQNNIFCLDIFEFPHSLSFLVPTYTITSLSVMLNLFSNIIRIVGNTYAFEP